MITDLENFTALDPFFRIIEKGAVSDWLVRYGADELHALANRQHPQTIDCSAPHPSRRSVPIRP